MLRQPVNPLLPALARVSGRTLLLAFVLNLVFVGLPFQFRSPIWGPQLSSRIVDLASVPLLAAALLCCAAFGQLMPDPEAEPQAAMRLARQRNFALRLCRWGVISLALLAFWQLPLLLGSTGVLNLQNLSESSRLSPVIQKAEQSIREASPADIDLLWQRFLAAGAPGLKEPVSVSGTEARRKVLLEGIKARKQEINRSIDSRGGQVRFAVVRDSLRRIGLCFIYGAGFFALRRSVLWAIRDPRFPLQQASPEGSPLSADADGVGLASAAPAQAATSPEEVTGWWDD